MGERREFEVAVIGLGGIGSSAVYRAAKRVGSDALGLERFELGHDRGASPPRTFGSLRTRIGLGPRWRKRLGSGS
jgi:glycine/D-amino acid oxidase-like deaminating enzyme